jgi:hypothetical protein
MGTEVFPMNGVTRAATPTASSSMSSDPLLELLHRYQTELKVFNERAPMGLANDHWDRIARTTWVLTRDEIVHSKPRATTAAGALLALDHVLQSEELFAEKTDSEDLQMLWELIKAARDFIAATESKCAPPK